MCADQGLAGSLVKISTGTLPSVPVEDTLFELFVLRPVRGLNIVWLSVACLSMEVLISHRFSINLDGLSQCNAIQDAIVQRF